MDPATLRIGAHGSQTTCGLLGPAAPLAVSIAPANAKAAPESGSEPASASSAVLSPFDPVAVPGPGNSDDPAPAASSLPESAPAPAVDDSQNAPTGGTAASPEALESAPAAEAAAPADQAIVFDTPGSQPAASAEAAAAADSTDWSRGISGQSANPQACLPAAALASQELPAGTAPQAEADSLPSIAATDDQPAEPAGSQAELAPTPTPIATALRRIATPIPTPMLLLASPLPSPLPRPTATPAAAGAAMRQTVSLSSPEYQILVAQNNERSRSGAAPLAVDPLLETLARQRANDMANTGYFSHGTSSGGSIFSMLAAAGAASRFEAENIARNDYPEGQTATIAMNGFLSSSGHRDNLLNPGFTRVGIGAARRGTMTYFAVIFAGP